MTSYDPKRSELIEKPRLVPRLNAARFIHLINGGEEMEEGKGNSN